MTLVGKLPASVVTTPEGVIIRILRLPKSTTKSFPNRSQATLSGNWKRASASEPSWKVTPDPPPV